MSCATGSKLFRRISEGATVCSLERAWKSLRAESAHSTREFFPFFFLSLSLESCALLTAYFFPQDFLLGHFLLTHSKMQTNLELIDLFTISLENEAVGL